MAVRARIEEFEALGRREGRDDGSQDRKNEANTEKRKRFLYPGSSRKSQEPEQAFAGLAPTRSKTSDLAAGFEADLQEVWSVRKNIHHSGKPLATVPSVTVKAGQYSRHGAIPAQQSPGAQLLSSKDALSKGAALTKKDDFSFEFSRSPLQEHNSIESTWKARSKTFSYSEAAKRPMGSPQVHEVPSPPRAKRKTNIGELDFLRPTNERRVSPVKRRESLEKVGYAKKMAQGYLRSVGIGEYTPKRNSYVKEEAHSREHKTTHWKKLDQDEFDF